MGDLRLSAARLVVVEMSSSSSSSSGAAVSAVSGGGGAAAVFFWARDDRLGFSSSLCAFIRIERRGVGLSSSSSSPLCCPLDRERRLPLPSRFFEEPRCSASESEVLECRDSLDFELLSVLEEVLVSRADFPVAVSFVVVFLVDTAAPGCAWTAVAAAAVDSLFRDAVYLRIRRTGVMREYLPSSSRKRRAA